MRPVTSVDMSKWISGQLHIQREMYLPQECCAILLGRFTDGVGIVENVCPIENISRAPNGIFIMHPQQQMNIVKSVADGGGNKFVKIVAHYHSHPRGAQGRPSSTDLAQAQKAWSIGVHIIHGEDGINAWHWDGTSFEQLPVRIA